MEAKAAYKNAGDGLQQAKDCAQILGLTFCYATNGTGIIEFDFTTGTEREIDRFPEPEELWRRYRQKQAIEDDEQAERLRKEKTDFFDEYGPGAREILGELLEKYAEHGDAQFKIPDVLEVPPISRHGDVIEIIDMFGGADRLRKAVTELQALLYAA